MRHKSLILFAVMAAVILSGCTKMREELGLNRHSPDEFTVVKRAPLTLPPEYNLRPPADATRMANTADRTQETARSAVFGTSRISPAPTDANMAFLQRAGADRANPEIRSVLDGDSGYVDVQYESTIDKILRRPAAAPVGDAIDPVRESERLRQEHENAATQDDG